MKQEEGLKGMYMNRCNCCGRTGFIVDAENGICNYCRASNRKPILEALDLESNVLKSNDETKVKPSEAKSKKKKIVSDSGVV
jgi:hypothetical protein